MLLTVALLVIYCVYAFLIGSIENSWFLLAGGWIAVAATYGTAMVRPWSRYLVYVLTAGFFAKLGLSIYDGFRSGFFGFQFGSTAQVARALLPTLLMTLLSAALLRHRVSAVSADRARGDHRISPWVGCPPDPTTPGRGTP